MDEYIDEEELHAEVEKSLRSGNANHHIPQSTASKPDGVDIVLGESRKKQCKCGSNSHERISHRDCPLNKKAAN